jgi:hypothetical protein
MDLIENRENTIESEGLALSFSSGYLLWAIHLSNESFIK